MRPPISRNKIVSKAMRANKARGTKPELIVKKLIAASGLRGYRSHWKKVPGRPDIAFVNKKIAVIVNGCFWHGCLKHMKTIPKTNRKYWSWKIEDNRARDKKNLFLLKKQGWRVYVLWEHDIKKGDLTEFMRWLKKETKRHV